MDSAGSDESKATLDKRRLILDGQAANVIRK